MPGWVSSQIAEYVESALGVACWSSTTSIFAPSARRVSTTPGLILYVKVGSGIGAGIVDCDGRLPEARR